MTSLTWQDLAAGHWLRATVFLRVAFLFPCVSNSPVIDGLDFLIWQMGSLFVKAEAVNPFMA